MQISEQRIHQFQQIYLKRYGREISKEEARKQGMQLLTLMQHIYQPISEKENQIVITSTKENDHDKQHVQIPHQTTT